MKHLGSALVIGIHRSENHRHSDRSADPDHYVSRPPSLSTYSPLGNHLQKLPPRPCEGMARWSIRLQHLAHFLEPSEGVI